MPSPIVNGKMLSMPIPSPENTNPCRFSDLAFDNWNYFDLLKQLKPSFEDMRCHLDPDIRPGLARYAEWVPAFGQVDAAQSHLENQGVGVGDLFLFFGWFRNTVWKSGRLAYCGPHIQAIYGYLQIGGILKGDEIADRCPWHPHAGGEFARESNTVYLASSELTINEIPTGLPGYGALDFCDDLVLTKPGETRSRWKRYPWMERAQISRHNADSLKDGYFQSVAIGQEFVIQDEDAVCKWAVEILRDKSTLPNAVPGR